MRFHRRRTDRPDPARRGLGSCLETLEERALLSSGASGPFSILTKNLGPMFNVYLPRDLPVTNPETNTAAAYSAEHQLQVAGPDSSILGNAGKIVSGTDRAGDEWTITVHGPGYVIVTDTSPNDGSLDDNIDTIQLVDTSLTSTYVTGSVLASNRVLTDGTIDFNELIDTSGVRSVVLNGFTLAETVAPATGQPNNANTGIFLNGGAGLLSFDDILAPIDTSTNDLPIEVYIGHSALSPTIQINSIFNTVYDSTATTVPANVPVTNPTVYIMSNGAIKQLDITSTTQAVIAPWAAFDFPVIGTTGRTEILASAVGQLNVAGAAVNLTASSSSTPFETAGSGLSSLGSATFNGPTDAVGLDVDGPVGSLTYNQGISNPTNLFLGTTAQGTQVPATGYGTPADQTSYAAAGYVGGEVRASKIKKLTVKTTNVTTLSPSNPDLDQINGAGTTATITIPGTAVAGGLITTTGSIGSVKITGDVVNTEIKTGYNAAAAAQGLQTTRSASKIGSYKQTGSLINGVVSASYSPTEHVYGTPQDLVGPGKITGDLNGEVINTGGKTPLGNIGAGFYAKTKVGKLPAGDTLTPTTP